jgi:serine/threonine protein kinase
MALEDSKTQTVSRQSLAAGEPVSTAAPAAVVPDDKTVISKRPPVPLEAMPAVPSLLNPGGLLTGTRLEHYELTEFVGGGGMGSVYRATDTRLGRTVAVKVLSRDQSDEETIRRFRNEAQSAARLDHPNIARVYYVGDDQGVNFIVFEFIEGANLRDEIAARGPLELEQALFYTLQIAEALEHSSSRDVIHRDIKPSNVLITATGQVKLVDMGLARMHQVEPSANDLTASGVMLGTFDYISPEQARDPRAADVRSDLYSLGCTLFYMLTGQPPFPEGTALQKLLRHNTDEPPDLRQFRPELSPRITAIVEKLLAKKPSQRHQSPDELIADIRLVGHQFGLTRLADYGGTVTVIAPPSNQWIASTLQIAAAFGLLVISIIVMETVAAPKQTSELTRKVRFKQPDAIPAAENTPDAAPVLQNQPPQALPAVGAPVSGDRAIETPLSKLPDSEAITADPAPKAIPANATADSPRAEAGDTTPPLDPPPAEIIEGPKAMRVVVAREAATRQAEDQVEFVSSLADACARAAELGVSEIELRYNGLSIERQMEIDHSRLAIRAAPGYRPVLVFQPQVQSGDDVMIRLAGGSSSHVGFEGVELRLELPADLPADGWSLFAMSTGQSLDLTECVLTVVDGDADTPSIHDQVSMIAVNRRRTGDMITMADAQVAMGQQARINLDRCIARGEASVVWLSDETPLTVRWNQGLLVTTQHLLVTSGSASEPQYYDQIVLDLKNVTAFCREGLYFLRRGPGKAFQFHVNAYAEQCVFVSDTASPLFEMVGLVNPPEQDELQSTGEGNRFSPADMPFLFVRQTMGSEPQVFKLGRRWSSETRSQAGVPWLHAPPLKTPAHEAVKGDFLIDESGDGRPGFAPLLLPEASSSAVVGTALPTS